jgi:hypothetical protein
MSLLQSFLGKIGATIIPVVSPAFFASFRTSNLAAGLGALGSIILLNFSSSEAIES